MMTDTATRRGVPVRDFTDAGTGESFTADVPHDFDSGAFDNYAAAGLIGVPLEQVLGPAPAGA